MENQTENIQSPEIQPEEIPTQEIPLKSFKFPLIPVLLSVLVLFLVTTGYLYYQNQQLKGMLARYQAPVATSTPTATPDATADWETYTNTKYGFELKYPSTYSQIQDKTKYPNSILILSANGKLYDLVVELWSSTSDIAKAYPTTSGNLSTMSLGGSTSLTFLKSSNPEIDQILSTFKFLEVPTPTAKSSPSPNY